MSGRQRIRRNVLWALASAALHVWFLFGLHGASLPDARVALQPSATWLESASGPLPAKPTETPVPIVPAPEPARVRTAKTRASKPATTPIFASEVTDGTLGVSSGENAQNVEAGLPDGLGEQNGSAAGSGEPEHVNERTVGVTQLSVWLNRAELERLALLRPTLTLLMAVPGYRDVFRGSSIRPFTDLQLLRVFLIGLRPERLALAGVHARGEEGLLEAAERVAAMRSLEVEWRGDADLRATSWVDNSGIDRGLAMHRGAFLIGARESLPGLLGTSAPGARVMQLSKLRRDVVMAWVVEDAGAYLPGLTQCGVQALHVSVAARRDEMRMSLTAHYASSAFAARASTCLAELQGPMAHADHLIAWLQAASGSAGSFTSQLRTSLTRNDVERLFDEISAALRHAVRA